MATQDIFDMTDTWNAGGTTFTSIKMNTTDSASASGSMLIDLQIGGTSQFHVLKNGSIHGKRVNFNIAAANVPIISVSNYSLTGSQADSLANLSGTWDTTGAPTAIKLDMTDTASSSASLLMDLQVGGASKFKAAKNGSLSINTAAFAAPTSPTDIVAHLNGVGTGAQTRLLVDTVSNNSRSIFATRRARDAGSGSPGAVQSADDLGAFLAFGYDGTAYTGGRAGINATATENWTSGANGARLDILTTSNTTASINTRFSFQDGFWSTNATGGDKGADTINAGSYFANNVAVPTISSTDTLTNKTLASPTLTGTVTGSATVSLSSPAANTTILTSTGYSLTGSNAQSLVDLAGTWNTTGTPTALKLNVTDVASSASSALLDLQVGGASRVNINKDGQVRITDPTQNALNTLTPAALIVESTHPDNRGPRLNFYHNSVSPADNDGIVSVNFWANNSSGTPVRYAGDFGQALTVTAGAESGAYGWYTYVNGTLATRMQLRAGLYMNGATGGDQGANTINASAFYDDGVAVPTISSTDTLSNKTLSSPTLSGTVAGTPTFSGANVFSGNVYPIRIDDGGYLRFYNATSGVDWAFGKPDASSLILYRNGTPSLEFDASGNPFMYGAAIPTISSTDTLTNKTLSNPTITGSISGSPIKIGDGTNTLGMTGTSPLLAVQGASFSTGITVRRDGNAEVGLQSTPTGNIGTWSAHNVQFMRNGTAMGGFDASSIFIGQVANPRFYLYNNAGTASTLTFGADSADTFLGSFTNAQLGIYTNSTKRINIPAAGGFELIDGNNLLVGTTTGSKIGTSTTSKLGFYNATPIVQPTAVADATGAGDVVAQLNALLSRMRDLGLIAT